MHVLDLTFPKHCRSDGTSAMTNSPLPPEHQTTFLVFESALLLLFNVCVFCASCSVQNKKVIIGSFLRIIQSCNKCRKTRTWESQPFIGAIPAGNIMTSAAILYAGALPSQALRVFKILNCCTISAKSFFRHQTKYLQPAVHSVWKRQQEELFRRFRDKKKGLILAGDGRADSPGHSAKYGSYTIIELTCNKVIDFKLVQVRLLK